MPFHLRRVARLATALLIGASALGASTVSAQTSQTRQPARLPVRPMPRQVKPLKPVPAGATDSMPSFATSLEASTDTVHWATSITLSYDSATPLRWYMRWRPDPDRFSYRYELSDIDLRDSRCATLANMNSSPWIDGDVHTSLWQSGTTWPPISLGTFTCHYSVLGLVNGQFESTDTVTVTVVVPH